MHTAFTSLLQEEMYLLLKLNHFIRKTKRPGTIGVSGSLGRVASLPLTLILGAVVAFFGGTVELDSRDLKIYGTSS